MGEDQQLPVMLRAPAEPWHSQVTLLVLQNREANSAFIKLTNDSGWEPQWGGLTNEFQIRRLKICRQQGRGNFLGWRKLSRDLMMNSLLI